MIEPAEALARLAAAVEPGPPVEVSLDACYRLVLASPVLADRDFPPTDRSAMDGFALHSADAARPDVRLRVTGEVRAGAPAEGVEVGGGRAARIFTGGVLPAGADAVVMVEETEEDPATGTVLVRGAVAAGQHVRPRGSEVRRGATVLEPGTPLLAPELAALASVGLTRVPVHRPPTVGVLSTGDEIVEPDAVPGPHQVRNSNAATLLAGLRELGLQGAYLGNAGDTAEALDRGIARGLAGDVLLVTGGVSVGEYDLVRAAVERAGVEVLFHKVAMKPGKPILAGRRGRTLVVGLPGNPVSAAAGFAVFVAPVLRRMMGYRRWANRQIEVELDRALSGRAGRTTYHLARVEWNGGRFVGHRVGSTGSGDVLSMVRANAFLVTPAAGGEFAAGVRLPALLWDGFAHR